MASLSVVVKLLKAVSDPNRMRIVKMLQHREMCVCEITEALGIRQPSVSRHMRVLEDASLVQGRRDGAWINYRLNPSPLIPEAGTLLDLLRGWLEDDPDVQALVQKASLLDRNVICARRPSAKRKHRNSKRETHTVL